MPRNAKYEMIYDVIRTIPRGKVATYGQIAVLAGIPGHARQVGYALHNLPEESDVPWHRVINSMGQISFFVNDLSHSLQMALLKKEGVRFDTDGRISLKKYGWRPEPRADRGA